MNKTIKNIRTIAITVVAIAMFLVMLRYYWGIMGYCGLMLAYFSIDQLNGDDYRKCKINVMWEALIVTICFISLINSIILLCVDVATVAQIPEYADNTSGAICIMFLAPITEELLFRGIVLRNLLKINFPFWLAILMSAILFGLCHRHMISIIMATFSGVAFGTVYWRTKNIYPTIVIHIVNNIMAFINLHVGTSMTTTLFLSNHQFVLIIIIVFLAIASYFTMREFFKVTLQEMKPVDTGSARSEV